MNAVIYARYSSDNQREESIEGQVRECLAYAEKHDLTVIDQYIDRAVSARTSSRPAFLRMVQDSETHTFEAVLVWKLDRFARNRYDSAIFKQKLKENGVRIVSATENISNESDGIILESVLEAMAEYYSAELSIKVKRGHTENALKCKSNGGPIPLGYRIGEDRKFEIVPDKAAIVKEIFMRYDNGEAQQAIADSLNGRGLVTQKNMPFQVTGLNKILQNRKYLGEYRYDNTVIQGGMPQIIEQELFDRVQKRLDRNRRAPGHAKAAEEYLLTTKLFCGDCGAMMVGDCGTSKTGAVHCYYKCSNRKRRKGCKAKSIRKHWIEQKVVEATKNKLLNPAEQERIANALADLQAQEDPMIPALEAELKECEKKLSNLMDAILAGIHTASTKEMLEKLEAQKQELKKNIFQARIRRPSFSKEQIKEWLGQFMDGDVNDPVYCKRVIDIFVNSIFVYSDKIVLAYNFTMGGDTLTLKDISQAIKVKSSDLGKVGSP